MWLSVGSNDKYARIIFFSERILAAIVFVPLVEFYAVENCFSRTKQSTKFVSPPRKCTDLRAKSVPLLTT
jgi:hypothetical protein